jgi:hypothetical protein
LRRSPSVCAIITPWYMLIQFIEFSFLFLKH